MHMADALITTEVGFTMFAAAAGVTAYSIRKVRQKEDFRKKIPLMGVVGAFVFAAQMVNFSIPGTGSSGHIAGGVLLAAIVGPEAGFLSMISILAAQCLFFGDGGLLALGCNIINMGFFGCFLGYKLIFRSIIQKGYTKKRIMAASIIGVMVGLQCGAFSVVLETLFSGITRLPFSTFVLFMQPIHLAIGLVEGIATGLVLNFVYENRSDILENIDTEKINKYSFKKVTIIFLIAALCVGGGVSLLASQNPDGLEWAVLKTAGEEELENGTDSAHENAELVQEKVSFLPDYNFKESGDSGWMQTAGNIVAGVTGSIITIVIIFIIAEVLSKKRKQKVISAGEQIISDDAFEGHEDERS